MNDDAQRSRYFFWLRVENRMIACAAGVNNYFSRVCLTH
jgi:hypothetical protein